MGRVRSEPRPGWGQWHSRSPLLCLSAVSVPPHQHSDLFGWHKVFPRKPGHWEVQGRVSGPRPATRPREPGVAAPRWVVSRHPVSQVGKRWTPTHLSPTAARRPWLSQP